MLGRLKTLLSSSQTLECQEMLTLSIKLSEVKIVGVKLFTTSSPTRSTIVYPTNNAQVKSERDKNEFD
jgi:hypothetical protein